MATPSSTERLQSGSSSSGKAISIWRANSLVAAAGSWDNPLNDAPPATSRFKYGAISRHVGQSVCRTASSLILVTLRRGALLQISDSRESCFGTRPRTVNDNRDFENVSASVRRQIGIGIEARFVKDGLPWSTIASRWTLYFAESAHDRQREVNAPSFEFATMTGIRDSAQTGIRRQHSSYVALFDDSCHMFKGAGRNRDGSEAFGSSASQQSSARWSRIGAVCRFPSARPVRWGPVPRR